MHKKQRWIEESDFIDNYILTVVEPSENLDSKFTVEDIDIIGDTLEFKYKVEKEPISWTVRYCEILLVEKASYKKVAFIENGKQEEIVSVKVQYVSANSSV